METSPEISQSPVSIRLDSHTEENRLVALKSYGILDTSPEKEFDELTRLAASICSVPASAITLIDENRIWFKSRTGIPIMEIERKVGFCNYTIKDDIIYEVENTLDHPIHSSHPYVTGEPGLRFYAGTPLVDSQGFRLGTLCVLDIKPGKLEKHQREALQILARQVISNLELRKQQRLLTEERNRLEKTNKQLDQFAYIVSHDLKAPLRAITNLSMWIEEDLGEAAGEDIKSNMELLRSRVKRMETLINGILEYSKAGRITEKVERVEVKELVNEVIEMIAPPPTFRINIPDNLPTLVTERVKLQQVFSNLISNAIKYHHTNQGTIIIGHTELDGIHEFFVQDDGPGIDPRFHEKIFQIFQTLESKDKVESTGIGLSIIQKIIEDKKGNIRLESEQGKGAKFIFTWK